MKPIYVDMIAVNRILAARGIYPHSFYMYWRAKGELVGRLIRAQYDANTKGK